MPCIKCSNGKYKYGAKGNCEFDTLEACKRAEAAINAQNDPRAQPVPDTSSTTTMDYMTIEDMYNQVNTPGNMGRNTYRM